MEKPPTLRYPGEVWTITYPLGIPPGLDSTPQERRLWGRKVDNWRACRNYDYMRALCYWCLSDDDQRFTDKGVRGGTYKYCREECRDTAALPQR